MFQVLHKLLYETYLWLRNKLLSTTPCSSKVTDWFRRTTKYADEQYECETENGLGFWQCREKSFPLVAPLAQDLVSALASQAYIERVFSVCGDLTARKCNRASVNLECRIFLKINKNYIQWTSMNKNLYWHCINIA